MGVRTLKACPGPQEHPKDALNQCSLMTWPSLSNRLSLRIVHGTPTLVQSLSHETQNLI